MRSMNYSLLLGAFLRASRVCADELPQRTEPSDPAARTKVATEVGRDFLVKLFDEELKLLPEYHGHDVYWLYHDNYLAAKVLAKSHPKIAQQIFDSIEQHGAKKSGKIEILFGEADEPLPFRRYQLVDVKRVSGKLLRTERITTELMTGWEAYADLLLMACLAEKDSARAKAHFDAGIAMWDGVGISDPATKAHKVYPTYKLALAVLAAHKLGPEATKQIPPQLIERLHALQKKSGEAAGGWSTDYRPDGAPVGQANVETTCMAILALECLSGT